MAALSGVFFNVLRQIGIALNNAKFPTLNLKPLQARGAGSNLGQGGQHLEKGHLILANKQKSQTLKNSLSLLNLYDWKMELNVLELNVLCTCAFGNIIFNYCYKNKIRMC